MQMTYQHNFPDSIGIRQFKELANRKGVLLSRGYPDPIDQQHFCFSGIDMDFVRASLENAIRRAKQRKHNGVIERLDRLYCEGTKAQQASFVLGPGRTYFFPEDVQKMVDSGSTKAHPFSLHKLSWMRCRPLDDGSQIYEEHSIQICLVD